MRRQEMSRPTRPLLAGRGRAPFPERDTRSRSSSDCRSSSGDVNDSAASPPAALSTERRVADEIGGFASPSPRAPSAHGPSLGADTITSVSFEEEEMGEARASDRSEVTGSVDTAADPGYLTVDVLESEGQSDVDEDAPDNAWRASLPPAGSLRRHRSAHRTGSLPQFGVSFADSSPMLEGWGGNGCDAAALTPDELAAMFAVLDGDGDGWVSVVDIAAFIALLPQTADGAADEVIAYRSKGAAAAALSSAGRRTYARWLLLHRRSGEMDQAESFITSLLRLVEFFRLSASSEAITTAAAADSGAGVSAGMGVHNRAVSAAPPSREAAAAGAAIPGLSWELFVLLYRETARILNTTTASHLVVLLDMRFLRQVWRFVCVLHHVSCDTGGDLLSGAEDAAEATIAYLGAFSSCRRRRHHRPQSHRHGGASSPEQRKAAMAHLLRRTSFFVPERSSPRLQSDSGRGATGSTSRIAVSSVSRRAASPGRAGSPRAAAGGDAHKAAVLVSLTWMAGAWEQRRNVLDVHVLQRFGEAFLEHKAKQQERQMHHFLRLYRHLLLQQLRDHHTTSKSVPGAVPSAIVPSVFKSQLGLPQGGAGAPDGPSSPQHTHQQAAEVNSVPGEVSMRSLLLPDPLSMLPGLNAAERLKLERFRFWAAVRACLLSLLAALLIGVVDTLAAHFFFGGSTAFADATSDATDVLFSWGMAVLAAAGLQSPTEAPSLLSNATAVPDPEGIGGTSTNSTGSPLGTAAAGFSPLWRYRLTVAVVAVAVSLVEIVLLYSDCLRVGFALAKTCGIPLHHHANQRSEYFLRKKENEVVTIKESLMRKRVRFVIAAIARCALELVGVPVTILSIDVTNRNTGCLSAAAPQVLEKVQKSAAVVAVRVVFARVLSKFLLPFAAVPLLMMWNIVISRRATRRSQRVVVGAVSCEPLTIALLKEFFGNPVCLTAINQPLASEGLASTFFHVPYHVYREALCLMAFIGFLDGNVHCSLHLIVVAFASRVIVPDAQDAQSGANDTIVSLYMKDFCRYISEVESVLKSMSSAALREHLEASGAAVRQEDLCWCFGAMSRRKQIFHAHVDALFPGWAEARASSPRCLFAGNDVEFMLVLGALCVVAQGRHRSEKHIQLVLMLRSRFLSHIHGPSCATNRRSSSKQFLARLQLLGAQFAAGVPITIAQIRNICRCH